MYGKPQIIYLWRGYTSRKTLINENEVLRKAKKNSYFRLEVQFYHVYLQMSLEKLLLASVFPKCMNIVWIMYQENKYELGKGVLY